MNTFKMGDSLWELLAASCNNRASYWEQAKRDDLASDQLRDIELSEARQDENFNPFNWENPNPWTPFED